MNRKLAIIVLFLLASCSPVFAQETSLAQSAEQGKLEATSAVREGKFVIKQTGLARAIIGGILSTEDIYEAMLEKKYNIRHEHLGGCLLDDESLSYITAYNAVSIPAMSDKFGPDIFENTRKEAEAVYKGEVRTPSARISMPHEGTARGAKEQLNSWLNID